MSYPNPNRKKIVKEIKGKWVFIDGFDNNKNDEILEKKIKKYIKTNIKTKTIKNNTIKITNEKEFNQEHKIDIGASWKIIKADFSSKININNKDIRSKDIEEKFEKEEDITYSIEEEENIKVGKKSQLFIYKVIYEDEGFYYEPGYIYRESEINEKLIEKVKIDSIFITFYIEKKRLLKNIKVNYTDNIIDRPDDIIEEVDGQIKCADINYKHGGKYVWLVPEYTYNINEAATDIKIKFEKHYDGDKKDLSKGDGNEIYRYLDIICDKDNNKKILFDKIKLYNTDDKNSKPTDEKYGYDRYTKDINEERDANYEVTERFSKDFPLPGFYPLAYDPNVTKKIKKHDYLYLCWDTIEF